MSGHIILIFNFKAKLLRKHKDEFLLYLDSD